MNLIKQPERWMCGLASFAMLFDLTIEQAISVIGHDGSEIWWPDLEEPYKRRGFHPDELVEAAMWMGSALIQFDSAPVFIADDKKPKFVWPMDQLEARIDRLLNLGPGLILGRYANNRWHMVAWDGHHVYDPMEPRKYSFDDPVSTITIETFWLKRSLVPADSRTV